MSEPASSSSSLDALVEFFTSPTRGSAAALFRMAFGVLSTWTAIGVLLNLERYYGDAGLLPWSLVEHFPEQRYSLLALAPLSDAWLVALAIALLLASVTLTVGFWPRASLLAIFAVHLALHHRNPYILNGGDRLFLIAAGLGSFMPLGMRWSVDAWRRARAQLATAPATVWGQRLIALQLGYVYLYSFLAKVKHPHWKRGEALADVLASPVLSEWPMRLEFTPLIRLLTWSTLAFELALPVLVWNRRLRPYVLVAGVSFHLGIEVAMTIPMFSAIMLVCYACFLDDAEAEWLVARLGALLRRRAGIFAGG